MPSTLEEFLGPNGVIYFVPRNAKNVGILDSASSSFTTLDIYVLGPTRRRDTMPPCTRPTVATRRWLQRTAHAGAPALLAAARTRRAALGHALQNPLHVWISNLRLKRGTMENGEHRNKPKKELVHSVQSSPTSTSPTLSLPPPPPPPPSLPLSLPPSLSPSLSMLRPVALAVLVPALC